MKEDKKKKALLAASVAGLIMAAGAVGFPGQALAEKCYGIAKEGKGDCGGKGHSCAGMNKNGGEGYLNVPDGLCEKIEGGSLTPSAE